MDLTSSTAQSSERLQNALPSQAHELLAIERRERARVDRESETLRAKESSLEEELKTALTKEEETIAADGMKTLQDFKQRDLTDLLKKENLETEKQTESVKNAGLANVNKAAQSLVNTALSHDLLSHL